MHNLDLIHDTLARLKPGDTVVVAVLDAGGAVTHTLLPQPRRLVDLATSLLDHAGGMLGESDEDEALLTAITEAIEILPDRFGDDDDDEEAA